MLAVSVSAPLADSVKPAVSRVRPVVMVTLVSQEVVARLAHVLVLASTWLMVPFAQRVRPLRVEPMARCVAPTPLVIRPEVAASLELASPTEMPVAAPMAPAPMAPARGVVLGIVAMLGGTAALAIPTAMARATISVPWQARCATPTRKNAKPAAVLDSLVAKEFFVTLEAAVTRDRTSQPVWLWEPHALAATARARPVAARAEHAA